MNLIFFSSLNLSFKAKAILYSGAGTGGAGGATGPPNDLQISYPYWNRGGQITPT